MHCEKVVSAPARRELVRHMVEKGLSERRSLTIARMSASAYRYPTRPDRNAELRQWIVDLAAAQALRCGDDPSQAAAGRSAVLVKPIGVGGG